MRWNKNPFHLAIMVGMVVVLLGAVACGEAARSSPEATPTTSPGPLAGGSTTTTQTASPSPETTASPTPTPTATPAPSPTPTPQPTSTPAGPFEPLVEPDPNYQEKVRRGNFSTRNWNTDFSRFNVDYREILSGGPGKDGIPSIDDPKFVTPEEAVEWLDSKEPVVSLELNGEAKAYPLQIMIWHEIANDVIGGVPVAVTFCPLCNSAIVFDRRLEGEVLEFGVSGNLRNSDLIMYDRQTDSWWQQLTGGAIVGVMTGRKLDLLASQIISFDDFRKAFPEGVVLSLDTGFSRSYGSNPYGGYDRVDQSPFLFTGELDERLLPMQRVVTVAVGDADVAFPYDVLEQEQVVDHTLNGQEMVVFFKKGTVSALDRRNISSSKDVGSTGVFDPNLDGQRLTFNADGDFFVDDQTGTRWNILGQAVEGEMKGKELKPVHHGDYFWFSWASFKPDTKIWLP